MKTKNLILILATLFVATLSISCEEKMDAIVYDHKEGISVTFPPADGNYEIVCWGEVIAISQPGIVTGYDGIQSIIHTLYNGEPYSYGHLSDGSVVFKNADNTFSTDKWSSEKKPLHYVLIRGEYMFVHATVEQLIGATSYRKVQ